MQKLLGLRGDFVYYPDAEGWMVSGAFSMLDTEITKTLTSSGDVVAGKELAFAPGMQGNFAVEKNGP